MSHAVVILKWQGLGYAPMIVGPGGAILGDVLAWTISEKRNGKSDPTLYYQTHAVRRFAEFWEHCGGRVLSNDLYKAFFDNLINGNKALGWNGVCAKTAATCLDYVYRFTAWAADQRGANEPNPIVLDAVGWVKALALMDHQKSASMLGHLVSATRLGMGIVEHRSIQPNRTARRSSGPDVGRRSDAMRWDDYVTLLRHERHMRNLLLWLMLGAGGLRVSEAVHIYVQDISSTCDGHARVLLADPRYGQVAVPSGANGEKKIMTRESYLREYYGLTTRDQLRPQSALYAGWKGMRVHDGRAMTAEIIWLHPDFGQLAWAAHMRYLEIRRIIAPKHPYYFVSIEHNTGAPLTISNARGLLIDACARLNIPSPRNLHSLRHMFGGALANRGQLEIEKVQVAMRHKHRGSTEIYTRSQAEMVRERLMEIDALRPPPEIQGSHEL